MDLNRALRSQTPDILHSAMVTHNFPGMPLADSVRKCLQCNTTHTPEWRRGPDGPRTLCNACGLRWSRNKKKKNKKVESKDDHLFTKFTICKKNNGF